MVAAVVYDDFFFSFNLSTSAMEVNWHRFCVFSLIIGRCGPEVTGPLASEHPESESLGPRRKPSY